MQAARSAALKAKQANGGGIPSYPGLSRRVPSCNRLSEQAGGAPPSSPSPGSGPLQSLDRSPAAVAATRRVGLTS